MAEKTTWSERRRNVRVPVAIRAKARLLGKESDRTEPQNKEICELDGSITSEKDLSDIWPFDQNSASFCDFMVKIEEESDPVISYFANSLIKIGEKLDLIIEKLGNESAGRDLAVKGTADICGAGVSLLVYEEVQVGNSLEISLQIPGFPLGWYKVNGVVVHIKPFKQKGEKLFSIGVEFAGITQRDQEQLIAFVFSRQRKNIRQSR